ncbi:U5 small nuclear ribonucleoprotein [Perkinsus chesapeaki]|uniref:U5 small nuclear ribonucleoprotein n=1 Tax=Perkinsus chesapeaki TaxID=330153 RepID=A0A7J6MGE5_PERCH|nr:U5 small nuclear ribonucleoprotein [Perkinsus chesapeaki]
MDYLLSGCAGQCKSAAATDALVSLNLKWCANSVIHQLYNDAETDCRVEMMQYKLKGLRPSKAKLERWSTYTSPQHLARFANESKDYVRRWTMLHRCRFVSTEQCRLLITLQHRLQFDLEDAARRKTSDDDDDEGHGEKFTVEGVSMQLLKDLTRGNVYVIGGKRFDYREELACQSVSHSKVHEEDGDTTAGEDSSPAALQRECTATTGCHQSGSEASSPCVGRPPFEASPGSNRQRFISRVVDEITSIVGRYCAEQSIPSEQRRLLTMAATSEMSQAGFANLEYSAVTTRQFVCEHPLQTTEVHLNALPDGTGIRVKLMTRKSEFSSYAVGYESTPPDVAFTPCGPGSSRTLRAEIVWRLREPQLKKAAPDEPAEFRVTPRADLLAMKNPFEVVLTDGEEKLVARPASSSDWHWRRIFENSLKISLVAFTEDGWVYRSSCTFPMALVASAAQQSLAVGGEGAAGVLSKPLEANRRSKLKAPTMLLTGHEADVFCCDFSADGANLASGGFDKNILVWKVYGDCDNWCILKGHDNAVLEVHWSSTEPNKIVSCSADKSLALWDVEEGRRIKKLRGHGAVVNSCQITRRGVPLVVSGGDDGTLDNQILSMDIRNMDSDQNVIELGPEHDDSITGLSVSNDGNFLLSNSMDKSVKLWDIRPFVAHDSQRLIHHFTRGVQHDSERNLLRVHWSPDDQYFTTGNAKRVVNVWDVRSREILYTLPGHTGSVNEVCFHPTESYVIASASSDRTIYLGELA